MVILDTASSAEKDFSDLPGKVWGWLWSHPFLLLLIAHSVFSIGIWNARDGYGEDTSNLLRSFSSLESHRLDASVYVNLITFILKTVTPDPVLAATLVKYLSSLFATVTIYLTLSCFSNYLQRGAILLASFVWISSSLNAPFQQSTSLSLFTFAVMLTGVYCLLWKQSVVGVVGFYVFGLTAASLRPEYFLPVALSTVFLIATAGWRASKKIEALWGLPSRWTCSLPLFLTAAALLIVVAKPPTAITKKAAYCDQYALFGLGQCYADFYRRRHPGEVFSPMTEYRDLLNDKFRNPTGFLAAIKNNPREAATYFALNAFQNLGKIPSVFLNFRHQHETGVRGILHMLTAGILVMLVVGILAIEGILSAIRLSQAGWIRKYSFPEIFVRAARRDSTSWKILLLLAVTCASWVAVILLVGTPRYFLPLAPLFYLGLACCADSMLRTLRIAPYEPLLLTATFIGFCSPHFLVPRPNYEMDSLRQIRPHVRANPLIAAWWADPDVVFGFHGKARAASVGKELRVTDIQNGSIDILMADSNLRSTKMWADNREFFTSFECDPEKWGFKKLTGFQTGRFDIYYRPKG